MRNKENIFKALIFERLNGIYKSAVIHEEKLFTLSEIEKIEPKNRKEEMAKLKEYGITEYNYDKALSQIDKQSTELFDKMQNKASLIDLFDNCVDLFADITKLFLRAYFDADKKLIIKPCILVERLDGNIEIDGKKYELKYSKT